MSILSKNFQLSTLQDTGTLTFDGGKVEISADGKKVTVYTDQGVDVKPGAATGLEASGLHIASDFSKVVMNGVTIEAGNNGLVITAPGAVVKQPATSFYDDESLFAWSEEELRVARQDAAAADEPDHDDDGPDGWRYLARAARPAPR